MTTKSSQWLAAVLTVALFNSAGHADNVTIGPRGVNSAGLKLPNGNDLNGAGIAIGQVEVTRPAKNPPDTTASTGIAPTAVYLRTTTATVADSTVGDHAEEVAGVMISSNGASLGVAPMAQLYASAYFTTGSSDQRDAALSANHVATRNSGNVYAINFSFGLDLDGFEILDGGSHLSHFVDWSAMHHDVLYIVANSETTSPAGPVPTDNFNGITVALSTRDDTDNVYRVAGLTNDYSHDAEGDRVSVDLLAPGENVKVIRLNNVQRSGGLGTSYAAPHVTAAVALLQQYAPYVPGTIFGSDARRHEVMKAILLNSADKKAGVHGSTRDVYDIGTGQTWEQSPAFFSEFKPLDEHMGAGHLNVKSALKNFEAGQHTAGTVPTIGWDYNSVSPFGASVDYVFNRSLAANSWVTITLAWDRRVETTDVSNTYGPGTEFFSRPLDEELADLNLYLLPADSDDLLTATRASLSFDSNVEHIFWKITNPGNYKIKVLHDGALQDVQDFGLAWWAGEVIPGDFDNDGDVDGDDLNQWKGDTGQNGQSDADGDGDSDGNDFLVWQRNRGIGVPAVAASSGVPEPGAGLLCVFGLLCAARRRR